MQIYEKVERTYCDVLQQKGKRGRCDSASAIENDKGGQYSQVGSGRCDEGMSWKTRRAQGTRSIRLLRIWAGTRAGVMSKIQDD